jgi:glutamate N-acetyltransferase/amino-acid N-acetyltransferase
MMVDTTLGVTAPGGFLASGVSCGLKSHGGKDLALVVNDGPEFHCAAVFTTNRFPAAPVQWSKQVLAHGRDIRGVVLNSGGANACTGDQGLNDARAMAEAVDHHLHCGDTSVLVASTGLIGVLLDMNKVEAGISQAADQLSEHGGLDAAQAIMTTDTVTKQAGYTSDRGWTVAGMAKGAGMLAPALATMLVVLTTDAIPPGALQPVLNKATSISFDRADSDGCMSTNDMVVLLANGHSAVVADAQEFQEALNSVCVSLAKQLIADAEGAEHSITITVEEAHNVEDGLEVARSIARSNLFKCAIAGNDPNWGRVLASMGTTQADFDPDTVDVFFNDVGVFLGGAPGVPRDQVDLSEFEVTVRVNLHAGGHCAVVWTNDLTHGYVSENADYSS